MPGPGLKVTGGEFKGRRLRAPGKCTRVRPTSNMVKEAMFDILAPYLRGSRVLDLFAGTGALGIEALSRGASEAVLVDNDPACCRLIEQNLALLGLNPRARVLRMDAFLAPARLRELGERFNLVLADPPYSSQDVSRILLAVPCVLEPRGILVVEHSRLQAVPEALEACGRRLTLLKNRRYGDTVVSFWKGD